MLDLNSKGLERRLAKKDYIFDKDNPNFERNNDHNLFFFANIQNLLNDLLYHRGYVFLNEVLDKLGIERRMIGQLAGWRKDAPRVGYIEIKVTQTRYLGTDVQEYFLQIQHDGLIFDVLGD